MNTADKSERMIGQDVDFQKTRRITGYLTPYDRMNDSKRAEVRDRVQHTPPVCDKK